MDLLEQYKTEHPEAFRDIPAPQAHGDTPLLIRTAMRLSGGRITTPAQARAVLLAGAGVMLLASLGIFFFFSGSSSAGKARFSTECFPVPCS